VPIPKPPPKKKKKQLGFDTPPLDHCQVCGIQASWPYVVIERHHIEGKQMGGRNNDPAFHSPDNRVDVCEGPCSSGCHKNADQHKPGFTPDELREAKRKDEAMFERASEILS
jgi:hypothetical protein